MQTGFKDSPRTDTARPATKIFCTALTRSGLMLHFGQFHLRIVNGILATVYLQSAHRLLEGYQRSMPISVRSYQCVLYSSCPMNSDQLALLIGFDRQRFFCMLLTASVSMAITWFSLINRVESLFRKPLQESAVLTCIRATLSLALMQLAKPLVFLANRCCSVPSRDWLFLKMLSAAIFSPIERIVEWVKPKSMPTLPDTSYLTITMSSTSRETKYLPAASFDTVTVVSLEALDSVRDQRIKRGPDIFANSKILLFQLKALGVYSVDCLSCLALKDGYLAHLAKNLLKALFKWRNACCTDTLETASSHKNQVLFSTQGRFRDSRFVFIL